MFFLNVFLFLFLFSCVTSFSELFFIKEPHDVTVMRRDAVILDCQAHGEAPIGIRWLKNGAALTESERVYLLTNGSLFISEVESRKDKSDEGFYQCLAQNKYGSILSQRARLTIASLSSFTQQPASITVMEGSVARFTCKIPATPPPIITWEFNRVTLPQATERITVLPSGVLQIQGVERADAGSYRCVATNIASRRRSSEAVLTVTAAPSPRVPLRPRIIAGPQNLTVAVHGTALLECMATGNPRPLISWSRADHKSIDVHKTKVLGNGNLLISDVTPQHAGIYFCRATTPGTRNYTIAAANITVLAAPSLVEWPESVTRPRAGTARFACVAEGFPTPQITWLKNGEPVHSNGRVKMYNSKLVINQIIPEDDGIYQCQAENEQGSVLAMARLIVVMSDNRPSAPRNVRAETVSSSAILLAWERPMYNSDKVIAYSVHYMKAEGLNNEEYQIVIGNDTTRYIIDELEAGRNYTFYIVAYMPMGASRMSDHVIQRTLEDVPSRAPELSLTSRSPSDIQVSWQPLSHKLSRGRVSGYRLSYRTSTDGAVTQLELSGHKTHHLLEGLQPDTTYLLRIAAATSVGWGEPSAWTSHRTPKASSTKVPLAPELQLESLNCTTVVLRWHLPAGSGTGLQGFKLSYHEESEPEGVLTQIPPHHRQHTIGGLESQIYSYMQYISVNVHFYPCVLMLKTFMSMLFVSCMITHSQDCQYCRTVWKLFMCCFRLTMLPSLSGSVTMALLENLQSGQVYLVKVSASNQMGDGPFSPAVELSVHADAHASQTHGTAFSDGFYHLDQRSMTGIVVGVCIALTCIIICILILACRRKTRKSSSTKSIRQAGGQTPPTAGRLANQSQAESVEVMMPMMRDHFIDAKGGTNLIINSYGPVKPTVEKKRRKRWNFFKRDNKDVKRVSSPSYPYHHGTTLLCYTETSPQHPPSSLHGLFGPPGGDSEGSHSSEGSHETGDSGRYSHDDTEATNLSLGVGSHPSSLQGEESEASAETPVHEVTEKELHLHMFPMTETTLQEQEMMDTHPV
uniref:Protogenin n=1 Tax=Cyprinus carpio TaxID=7962 RepID=A0A8C1I809_CYPCA